MAEVSGPSGMSLDFLRKLWRRIRARTPRWLAIPACAVRDFNIDNGFHWSAAIAFYGLLSIFPLALAGVAIAAWFVDPDWATEKATEILGDVMPRGGSIREIIEKAIAARGQTSVISIAVLLWAGSRVFAVLIRALNIAFDVDELYSFGRRLLVELGMLLTVGLFFIGALVSDLLVPLIGALADSIPHGRAVALDVIDWTLPALLLLGGFFSLYKFVPRHRANWQSTLIGAIAATALCLGARPLFLAYLGTLASYSHIYGWLAIGIVFLVWTQIVAVITLYGGELASHIQMMVYDGLSGEEVTRRHRERSTDRTDRTQGGD